MKRILVSSSDLRSVGFENGTLEIEFNSGGVYQYSNVPLNIYNGLMNAASKGQYFHRVIKGNYNFIKIS